MLTRSQKAEKIADLSDKFSKAKAAFVVDFKGIDVAQVTDVRKTLRGQDSEIKVVRNTLVKLALKDHPEYDQALSEDFVGTNAVVFAYDDVSASAKAIVDLSKGIEALQLKTGAMAGEKLSSDKIQHLATLPSKDVLRAQLLSLFTQPATSFVRVLNAGPSSFLNVLNAYKDSKDS